MKVYITKYCISNGILEREADEPLDDHKIRLVKGYSFFYKPDWHFTREEAIIRANEMRENRIQNLKNQIKNIEKIVF